MMDVVLERNVPVACMSAVPLSFSQLDLDRQTHNNGATQTESLVYQVNITEFDIANAVNQQ